MATDYKHFKVREEVTKLRGEAVTLQRRIIDLRTLLEELKNECETHNSDYHHRTPDELLEKVQAELDR